MGLIKNMKKKKERRKFYEGLVYWKQIMDEMRESGEYSDEDMKNISLWFGEACVQYGKMF